MAVLQPQNLGERRGSNIVHAVSKFQPLKEEPVQGLFRNPQQIGALMGAVFGLPNSGVQA